MQVKILGVDTMSAVVTTALFDSLGGLGVPTREAVE
jgi:hypothetical protein